MPGAEDAEELEFEPINGPMADRLGISKTFLDFLTCCGKFLDGPGRLLVHGFNLPYLLGFFQRVTCASGNCSSHGLGSF